MIYGISGRQNSGKDLTGKIIQYLIACHNLKRNYSYLEFEGLTEANWQAILNSQDWKIKKFADKLKDIVCLLLNCTREQLEDREFKETELGEEWKIKTISYIDGNKQVIVNPTPYQELNIKSKYPSSCDISINKLTPRLLLQKIGTDLFRYQLHPNCWVNATMVDYKGEKDLREKIGIPRELPLIYPNWIITDVRFPNEAQAIKDRGGIIIRVNRPRYCVNCTLKNLESQDCFDCIVYQEDYHHFHQSEIALDNYEFDYVIDNNSTIAELIEKVKEILIKEKII
jgi:hypothetical protein